MKSIDVYKRQTKYPDVKLPTSGSMLGIWADEPANEYKEEEVFQVMEAFANHNKDYFKADSVSYTHLLSKTCHPAQSANHHFQLEDASLYNPSYLLHQ